MHESKNLTALAAQSIDWITQQTDNPEERAKLARKLFDEITAQLLEDIPDTGQILAPNAVVEVIDSSSGCLYRRYLELAYDETDNGLRLLGDDIGGRPAQIVFLSNAALEKIHDLQGEGPDSSPCDD